MAAPTVPESARDPFLQADGHIRPLREVERDLICRALTRYGGRKTSAARALGISKSTFFKKLHDLDLFVAKQRTHPSHPQYQRR